MSDLRERAVRAYEREREDAARQEEMLRRQARGRGEVMITRRVYSVLGISGDQVTVEWQVMPDGVVSDTMATLRLAGEEFTLSALIRRDRPGRPGRFRPQVFLYLDDRCEECNAPWPRGLVIESLADLAAAIGGEGRCICPKCITELQAAAAEGGEAA